jgi:TonB family protein
LTITVQVPEQPTLRAETLVAIFEGEGLSQYAVPLEHVPDTNRLSATVDLGRLSSTIGSPLKATLLHVVLARQQGLHTEELVRKSVVVTIATPGYADRSVRTETTTGAVRTRDLFGAEESAEAGLPLLDGGLQEENLLGNAAPEKQDGYWKLLRLLLHHRLRDEFAAPRPGVVVRRMPGIHFRLYANGEAQLIEVERSSGNAQVDQAALMSVVNAHPFPPFPAGSSESPVDVHIDLPVVSP